MKKTLNTITDESMVDRLTMEELEEIIGSGSGHGSGYESGSGSGEDSEIHTIQAGNKTLTIGDPIIFQVHVNWTSGTLTKDYCSSTVHASVDLEEAVVPQNMILLRCLVDAQYIGGFYVRIVGEYKYVNRDSNQSERTGGLLDGFSLLEEQDEEL